MHIDTPPMPSGLRKSTTLADLSLLSQTDDFCAKRVLPFAPLSPLSPLAGLVGKENDLFSGDQDPGQNETRVDRAVFLQRHGIPLHPTLIKTPQEREIYSSFLVAVAVRYVRALSVHRRHVGTLEHLFSIAHGLRTQGHPRAFTIAKAKTHAGHAVEWKADYYDPKTRIVLLVLHPPSPRENCDSEYISLLRTPIGKSVQARHVVVCISTACKTAPGEQQNKGAMVGEDSLIAQLKTALSLADLAREEMGGGGNQEGTETCAAAVEFTQHSALAACAERYTSMLRNQEAVLPVPAPLASRPSRVSFSETTRTEYIDRDLDDDESSQ